MKNLTFLLLFALFIYGIFCDHDLLSKFHQNGFKFKDYREEVSNYSEQYFNFFEIKTFKYNRTTAVINTTLNFKIAVKDKIEIEVQGNKFLSNEYRFFPIQYQVNARKAFLANVMGLQKLLNCGNFTGFLFEKDVTYHACNFYPDERYFPPLLPDGRYRFDLKWLYCNEEIAITFQFMEIYTPIEYPKK